MTACQQTGDSKLYRLGFAYNDFTNLLRESFNVIGHAGMICGNNAFRKHEVGGNEFPACYFWGCFCFVAEFNKSSFSSGFGGGLAGSFGFTTRVLCAFLLMLVIVVE